MPESMRCGEITGISPGEIGGVGSRLSAGSGSATRTNGPDDSGFAGLSSALATVRCRGPRRSGSRPTDHEVSSATCPTGVGRRIRGSVSSESTRQGFSLLRRTYRWGPGGNRRSQPDGLVPGPGARRTRDHAQPKGLGEGAGVGGRPIGLRVRLPFHATSSNLRESGGGQPGI